MASLLYGEENGVSKVKVVCNIMDAISEAIAIATAENRTVRFEFSEVIVSVNPDSDLETVFSEWQSAFDKLYYLDL